MVLDGIFLTTTSSRVTVLWQGHFCSRIPRPLSQLPGRVSFFVFYVFWLDKRNMLSFPDQTCLKNVDMLTGFVISHNFVVSGRPGVWPFLFKLGCFALARTLDRK